MLYVIYGTDSQKAREKLHELLALAAKKRPDAELFKITAENYSDSQFDELLVSQGLFEQKYTVVLDNLFEKKDIKSHILEKLNELDESEQIFLMLESLIDAASLKKIEKKAKQVQEFKKPESQKQTFNIFSITNGLVFKDKKNLWIDYINTIKKGVAAEEIHGIFFWQIKNMLLASQTKNVSESGLSLFAYKNALNGSKKYSLSELKKLSNDLVSMTHKVRTGEGELPILLEKWILKI